MSLESVKGVNQSSIQKEGVGDIIVILNEEEWLEHTYRRYAMIKLETIVDCIDVLKVATSKEAAINIMKFWVRKHIDKCIKSAEEKE